MPHVEAEHDAPRNDVARAGLRIDLADRGGDAAAFHGENKFRGGAQGVAAQFHRRGARRDRRGR